MLGYAFVLMATTTICSAMQLASSSNSGLQIMDLVKNMPTGTKKRVQTQAIDDDSVRFFMIGDYGELSNYFGVRRVGMMMNEMAKMQNFDYIITVGDNFYNTGIDDINYRFKPWIVTQQFERENLRDLPIYATLGNHDCYTNFTNEIVYSQYNDQWNMPSDYYELVTPLKDDPEMNFVNLMLNSCKLICPDNKYNMTRECGNMHVDIGGDEVMRQYAWLEEKLEYYTKLNTTAWLAVSFHHVPFLEDSLKEVFLPMVRKYGIDFMFVGHEHWSEYTNMDPDYKTRFPEEDPKILKNCTDDTEILVNTTREHTFKKNETLHQFISGNGGHTLERICPYMDQDGSVYFKNDGYYGMTTVEATSKKVSVTFHRDINDIVYKINIEA